MDRPNFRRGDICKRNAPPSQKKTPSYYLVMKVLDPRNILVARIYEHCDENSIKCQMSNGYYRIRYTSISKELSRDFQKEENIRLFSSRDCVNQVYEKPREYYRRKRHEARMKKIEARRIEKELKEQRRLRLFDLQKHECAPVPASVSRYARHPYQGGQVSPR